MKYTFKDFVKENVKSIAFLLALPISVTIILIILNNLGKYNFQDLGSFVGGILSYIGTIGLGLVSIWQVKLSKKSQEYALNEEKKLLEEKERREIQPYITAFLTNLKYVDIEKVEGYGIYVDAILENKLIYLKKMYTGYITNKDFRYVKKETVAANITCETEFNNKYTVIKLELHNVGAGHAKDVELKLNDYSLNKKYVITLDHALIIYLSIETERIKELANIDFTIKINYVNIRDTAHYSQVATIKYKEDKSNIWAELTENFSNPNIL